MAGNLGGLVVTLGLDAVQFFTGLTKSEQQAKKFSQQLDREIGKAAKFAAANFIILEGAILGAAYAIDRLVKQAANFQDLEEKTGANAEALASFSVAAQVAGTNMDDVGAAMNKLAKNLTGVDDESKAAGAALKALGIPIEQFKALDPAAQIQALAKAFGEFDDSAQKSAAAMALLGKSGAQLLPFFKELESGSGRQSILTKQQIKEADDFADAQKRLAAQVNLYAQAIAVEMLPAITGFITASKEFIVQLTGIDKVTGDLARDRRIREFAEDAAKSVAYLVSAIDILARSFMALGISAGAGMAQVAAASKLQLGEAYRIGQEWRADMAKLLDRPLFTTTLDKAFNDQRINDALRRQEDRGFVPKKKTLDFEGAQKKTGADKASQEARRMLDTELRSRERAIRLEQDLLRDHAHYLEAYYEDNLLTISGYYAERIRIEQEAQRRIAAEQTAQIAAAERFAQRADLKPEDKEAANERAQELRDRRAASEREAARAVNDLERAAVRAMRAYEDSVADVNAQMQDLIGNTAEAARIRFERQNRDLRARATTEGNTELVRSLDTLGKQVEQRERVTEATREYSDLMARLGNEQARTDIAAKSGAMTTLDAMNKRAETAQRYIGVLSAQADAAERAARAMAPGPEQAQALIGVERLRIEIEALAQSAYELEDTFRETFEDTFATALTDVITGTKSLSDAFKDMERQIVASISRIAAQNIAESIFGQTGPAGGASGLLASFFGGKSRGGGGGLLGWLFGGGGLGYGSSFSGSEFGLAAGGPVGANRPVLVGEKGPELFMPRAAGNIVPNSELMARRAQRAGDINISINVPGNVSRATADQIALRTGAAVQRAINRNG